MAVQTLTFQWSILGFELELLIQTVLKNGIFLLKGDTLRCYIVTCSTYQIVLFNLDEIITWVYWCWYKWQVWNKLHFENIYYSNFVVKWYQYFPYNVNKFMQCSKQYFVENAASLNTLENILVCSLS